MQIHVPLNEDMSNLMLVYPRMALFCIHIYKWAKLNNLPKKLTCKYYKILHILWVFHQKNMNSLIQENVLEKVVLKVRTHQKQSVYSTPNRKPLSCEPQTFLVWVVQHQAKVSIHGWGEFALVLRVELAWTASLASCHLSHLLCRLCRRNICIYSPHCIDLLCLFVLYQSLLSFWCEHTVSLT